MCRGGHFGTGVENLGHKLLSAFETGRVPAALAPVFIRRDPSRPVPSETWSWSNRFLAAMAGHYMAAGGRQAELVGQPLEKGRLIFLEGELEPQSWEDKETDATKYRTQIHLRRFQLLPRGGHGRSRPRLRRRSRKKRLPSVG